MAAPRPGIARPDLRGRLLALARRFNVGLIAITLAGALFGVYYTLKVSQWSVMSDELQYAKLGLSIGDTFSPIPVIRGAYTGSLAQLYPLLIAPFMTAFNMPTAFRVIHAWNAVLMASTAIPAYLLTREIVASRVAAYLVSALTISVPWMVMSTMMLTEVAAYPAFVWAILALQRSLAKPSPKRDVLALGGLFLTFLGRTQFLVLLPVFALALVLHEVGWAAAGERLAPATALRAGVVRAVRSHRLLAWVGAVGAVVAVPLALTGAIDQALGRYETTVHGGDLLPNGIYHTVALHLDFVVVGIGVLPFVLAAAWAFGSLLRPSTKEGHAFAMLSIITVVAIVFEATSFNLRFSLGGLIQDRYVFYIVPLLFVGMAACLLDERRRSVAVVAVGAAFAWLVSLASFAPTGDPFFSSPDAVFHPVLNGRAGNLGELVGADITAKPVLVIGTIVLSIAVALALRRLPRQATLLAVGLPVLAYCMAETAYVFHKVLPTINHGPPSTLAHRDWVDTSAPSGAKVGALVAPINTNWDGEPLTFGPGGTEAWWQDTEFWNKSISRVYLYRGYGDYAPFKTLDFSLDYRTGRVKLPDAPPVIAMSASDPRFGLAATWSKPWALLLVKPAKPYRAEWATQGIAPDGWTKPGEPARIRLYPQPGGQSVRRRVAIILQPSGEVPGQRRFQIRIGDRTYRGVLQVGQRHDVIVTACIPANHAIDGTITASTPAHVKPAGVRITRIRSWNLGTGCEVSR